MHVDDVKEWFRLAKNDYLAAQYLYKDELKPYEIISYLCAQSVEKILKGYLIYHDIIPKKTHNLAILLDKCVDIDSNFDAIRIDCVYLNTMNNEVRYPGWVELTDEHTVRTLNAVAKVFDFELIKDLIERLVNS